MRAKDILKRAEHKSSGTQNIVKISGAGIGNELTVKPLEIRYLVHPHGNPTLTYAIRIICVGAKGNSNIRHTSC